MLFEGLVWLGLFLPLASFMVLMLSCGKVSRFQTGLIACGSILLSFCCFTAVLYMYVFFPMEPVTSTLFRWLPVEGVNADFALRVDPLSILMTLIVTGVGFLIHVYSYGYMEHDAEDSRFFVCMNFFIFSMLLLVLAQNLLLLYAGWEGVGLASYLLIGFWYTRPKAAQAATKAFVVNRIGDLGLLLGILLTFYIFGTSDFVSISQQAEAQFAVGTPLITVLTLLYLTGAVGKSAQLPLHVWLPDAMEGPTPVSALIHAATMVTAGVYLVVRTHALFMLAPISMCTVGVIGGVTALFAALCALGQTDLKRVLAFSTVSQLGLMFLTCGIGAFYAAMFHLTTHAFVKALLFLSAGNIVHMMDGITDMRKMGGLASIFTKSHWFFLIGALALSGIPPLAAFFSKDLILEEELMAGYTFLFLIALAASFLTGIYLTRAYCLTFLGPQQLSKEILSQVKEAPKVMLLPVGVLAFLSIVGGFLGFSFGNTALLQGFLGEIDISLPKPIPSNFLLSPEAWLSIGIAFLGVSSTLMIYTRFLDRLGQPLTLLKKSFYLDEVYDIILVSPLRKCAQWAAQTLEPQLFDNLIYQIAEFTKTVARGLQQFQSGQIRSYIAWMVLGAVILIVYFVLYIQNSLIGG